MYLYLYVNMMFTLRDEDRYICKCMFVDVFVYDRNDDRKMIYHISHICEFYMHLYTRIYVYIYIYVYIPIFTFVCIYVCMCVCMYVWYVCMYVYI
jgi:hypothetical protein